MKTINKLLLISILASIGVSTVSAAEVSQHPSYPFDEGNYWTDSTASNARINFSMESVSISKVKLSQHPSYPFDNSYPWTDTSNELSRVNFSLESTDNNDTDVSQHPNYPFDE